MKILSNILIFNSPASALSAAVGEQEEVNLMNKLEDKHLEHIARMHAITDYSWHSWNSPIGLAIGLISMMICLNGFALLAILIKYLFLMK